jgi:hypothetical protein
MTLSGLGITGASVTSNLLGAMLYERFGLWPDVLLEGVASLIALPLILQFAPNLDRLDAASHSQAAEPVTA